jgi:hypothetical protein
MKIGQGLVLMGVLAASVGYGCGGGSGSTGTSLDMCLQQGTWKGSGGCGVMSFDVSSSSGEVVLTDFGENPEVTFTADSARTKLTASGLEILFAPDHTCTITCAGSDSLALHCTNPNGGKCDSTFTPEAAALP